MIKKSGRKKFFLYRLVIFLFVFSQLSILFLAKPKPADSGNLTSSSVTLSNSRFSYRGGITTGTSASSVVTIDSSGNADNDTNHLFPGDTLCFADASFNGCSGQTAPSTYTVHNIPSTTTFNMKNPLAAALGANDLVIATQSGTLTISFVNTAVVPSNGDILITIPAVNTATAQTNDGFPDTASTVAANGFDFKNVAASGISTTGCTDANWNTTETVTTGTTSTDHTIRIDRQTTSCAAGTTITVTITNVINPAPISSGHTQGTADVYMINAVTRDGSDNTLDTVDMKVAPIEAVFVSATVDETLSFSVAGVASSTTHCGATTSVTTTAMTVPWGTISTANSFLNAAQTLTLSTNAYSGYSVKIEENDQMGRDGNTCTGATPAETAGTAGGCIKDTTCNAACSESSSAEWTTATNNGLGFSLNNISGSNASFTYNESSRTFSAREIADQEASETKANIMSATAPVSGSSVDVCYRITTSSTQPAGYYYNIVKYTATGVF